MKKRNCSPGFRSRLDREIDLRIREMADGCVECLCLRRQTRDRHALCDEHQDEVMDLITNPRKFIKLR